MNMLSLAAVRKHVTEWDGVLPDGVVEGLPMGSQPWQEFLDLAHSRGWPRWWRNDYEVEPTAPPADAAMLLSSRAGTLALDVGEGVQVNVFPFADSGTFDFDFDLRELHSDAQASALGGFIRQVGRLFSRPVLLRYEGSDTAFLRYDPHSDSFTAAAYVPLCDGRDPRHAPQPSARARCATRHNGARHTD